MIYFVQDQGSLNIKIGFHAGEDSTERIKSLQTGCPSRLVLLATCAGMQQDERRLHDKFSGAKVQGEWFRPTATLLQFIISRASIALANKAITQAADHLLKEQAAFLAPSSKEIEDILMEFDSRGIRAVLWYTKGTKKPMLDFKGGLLTENDYAIIASHRDSIIAWLMEGESP